MTTQTAENPVTLRGIEALRWLGEQGAKFALPRGRTKGTDPDGKPTLERDWQNKPHTLKEAIEHTQSGGNVGLLTGQHSNNIIVIDRDKDFPATVKEIGHMANTAKIVRDNAPDRGKLLYRITSKKLGDYAGDTDVLPRSGAWKQSPSDEQPALECLSTGRHAIAPPSIYKGGEYILIDQHYGIKEVTTEQVAELLLKVAISFDFEEGSKKKDKASKKGGLKQRVSEAWTLLEVFQHFDRAGDVVDEGGEIRLKGNGGLLINGDEWFCHSAGVGGDLFEAWSWCKHGQVIGGDKKRFKEVLDEMALAKGISDGSDGSDDGEQKKRPSQADLLYQLAMSRATFFTGRQDSQVYASVAMGEHKECYRMRSAEFGDWLAYAFYTEHGTTVNNQAAEDCKKLLSFEAKKTIADVFVRVGHHMGKVYIDLGSPEWDAIEVDENGWRIVKEPPVHFRRSNHMLPLALPVEHLEPGILARYVNIEDQDWPLVAAWVTSSLHPRGPFPVLGLLSRAGSGKSTALRVLKRIIDPSSAELRSQPNDVRDLYIAASNSWLLAFDNVSHISPEVADALCVISTGGGFTRKSNYTDDTEHVINVQRPIMINGIGDVVTRADLMDRTILIGTPTIPEEKRQDENDFWQGFDQDRPKILGAFLFALSTGLKEVGNVRLEKKPRMADFAKLAVAAESAYTDTHHDFMEMYTANREGAASVILENSPLGDVLLRIATTTEQKLTPEELYTRLNAEAKDYEKNSRAWPGAPNKLKSPIERLAPALERQGVRVGYKPSNGKRLYKLQRISKDGLDTL